MIAVSRSLAEPLPSGAKVTAAHSTLEVSLLDVGSATRVSVSVRLPDSSPDVGVSDDCETALAHRSQTSYREQI
jgi:hypothetical protein